MSHAKLFSPSKAEGWFACAGRAVLEAGFPDMGSGYSDDGTARHAVCASALTTGMSVNEHVGYFVRLADGHVFMPEAEDDRTGCIEYVEDWVEEDQDYVDVVRALAEGGELFVEQRLDFRRFIDCTDPNEGFGTGDAVVLKPIGDGTHELVVIDRKTGYVEVEVERNKQLLLYALGAYDEHSLVYDISHVRLIIHQRRATEWDCTVAELLEFAKEARSRAITVVNAVQMHGKVDQAEWERTFLNQRPSEDACRYCKAMATCPSMQRKVQETVGADFDVEDPPANLTKTDANLVGALSDNYLSIAMAATSLIEDWIKAVRAEVERRLLAGTDVPGFKLVLGKAGARAWRDAEAAEAALKAMRLKREQMYDFTVISPTSAEKLAPKYSKDGVLKPNQEPTPIGHRQWQKLQAHITRSDPKPSVAPESDKRDRYVPPNPADDFTPVADDASALC